MLLALATVVVAAAPHYHRTHPNVRCFLPERDYQYRKLSTTLTSVSTKPLVLRGAFFPGHKRGFPSALSGTTSNGRREDRIKAFQFVENATLQIDHCSTSRMLVQVAESGRWTVSLRADQSAPPDPLKVTTSEPVRHYTEHLRRNEFHVAVRCYGGYGADQPGRMLGKPQVLELPVRPFWVQKDQPYQLFQTGYDPRIADHFELLDRVEVDFAYRIAN